MLPVPSKRSFAYLDPRLVDDRLQIRVEFRQYAASAAVSDAGHTRMGCGSAWQPTSGVPAGATPTGPGSPAGIPGSGAVFATTPPALRDAWRSSRNGRRENANERREDFVQPSNCPTQDKVGLQWATVVYDMGLFSLDPQRRREPPGGIVRFRTVVIQENSVEAAITKEGAAEFSDIRRCFHPARRFRIEISKFLQLSILFFRQKLNAHGRCHINYVIFWSILFP